MANFDAMKVKNDCVAWIRDWFEHNGKNCNAVIGISGGKDSSIVAALCVEALGKERVIGVMMPQNTQSDIDDSYAVVKHLGIKHMVINIGPIVDLALLQLAMFSDMVISEQTKINLPPRIRMSTLYAVSQSVNGRVANTCNWSEDYIGYSTRWGDSVGDFAPLANLTSDEVIAIGDVCDLPYELTHKTPSDGLCGKTDEDNFGFTYDALNKYIRTGVCEDEEVKAKIDNMHEKNLFKLMPIPSFHYNPLFE
jgi:NAD+ synthase